MSNEIKIPDDEYISPGEEAADLRDAENATWLIDHDGATLPVTAIFRDGERIFDPIMATACVAFDSRLTSGKWMCISKLEPGDVWSKVP